MTIMTKNRKLDEPSIFAIFFSLNLRTRFCTSTSTLKLCAPYLFVCTREKWYLPLMYTMYNIISCIVVFYTHMSTHVLWNLIIGALWNLHLQAWLSLVIMRSFSMLWFSIMVWGASSKIIRKIKGTFRNNMWSSKKQAFCTMVLWASCCFKIQYNGMMVTLG